MAKKTFQRHIRINGKMLKSPKGLTKLEADLWYQKRFSEKHAHKENLIGVINSGPSLGQYFQETWFKKRKKKNPLQSTWGADQQRFVDYVAPEIGAYKISKINSAQVKACLLKVVEKHGRSPKTRARVQSLLSKIFRDARNEMPPLVNGNPVQGIEFDDPRTGKKEPRHIKKLTDVVKYFAAAESLSSTHLAYAGLAFFASLRKSELIPLLWSDQDPETNLLTVSKRFIQASNTIEGGTKSGSDEGRGVGISDGLAKILRNHRAQSEFNKDHHFILAKKSGKNFGPRDISRLNDEICLKAGVSINPHGLRHSYGRFFSELSGGNMKALQTHLGHSTISVTEIYSTLSGERVLAHRNVVKLEASVDEEGT